MVALENLNTRSNLMSIANALHEQEKAWRTGREQTSTESVDTAGQAVAPTCSGNTMHSAGLLRSSSSDKSLSPLNRAAQLVDRGVVRRNEVQQIAYFLAMDRY